MAFQTAAERYTLIETDIEREQISLAEAVRDGLSAPQKTLPCWLFYDEEGSEIFEEICDLPEYYLTRAEREILARRADEIAALFPEPTTLVELGSGSSSKTRLLIEAFLRRHGELHYMPLDVSRTMLDESALELLDRYDGLEITAIASEYEVGLPHVRQRSEPPMLVAWLGSTIGNLEPGEAAGFLERVSHVMTDEDRFLVGVDLRKDSPLLERAYDDDQGITARFNLNLLTRINRELGADFATDAFRHEARYDEKRGRVEMHLVSQRDQRVSIRELDLAVDFAEGESIHTENSHKYDPDEIDGLARSAALRVESRWLDSGRQFSLNLLGRATAPD